MPAKLKPKPEAMNPSVVRVFFSLTGLEKALCFDFVAVNSLDLGLMMPVFKNLLELVAPKTLLVGFEVIF